MKSQQSWTLSESGNILSTKIDNLEARTELAGRFSLTEAHVSNPERRRALLQNMMANIDDDNKTTRYLYMDFDQAHAMFLSKKSKESREKKCSRSYYAILTMGLQFT